MGEVEKVGVLGAGRRGRKVEKWGGSGGIIAGFALDSGVLRVSEISLTYPKQPCEEAPFSCEQVNDLFSVRSLL